jgi:hypothetical protein
MAAPYREALSMATDWTAIAYVASAPSGNG